MYNLNYKGTIVDDYETFKINNPQNNDAYYSKGSSCILIYNNGKWHKFSNIKKVELPNGETVFLNDDGVSITNYRIYID